MFQLLNSSIEKELTLKNVEKAYNFSICGCIVDNYSDILNYYKFLNVKEKETLKQIRSKKLYSNYIISRYMAKKAISILLNNSDELTNICIEKGIFNYPIAKINSSKNIQISISHSNNFICAIAFDEACPMGIDIEKVDHKKACNVEKALSKNFDSVGFFSKDDITITHWTCIESLSKVLKTGVTLPLKTYNVENMILRNNSIVSLFTHFYQFKSSSFKIEDYILTLCYPQQLDLLHNFTQ
jgi:phosphopantetheinyl transferase